MGCQYGEDVILKDFFSPVLRHIVIDVGAADGFKNSNTFQMINKWKWSGILIEPHPVYAMQARDLYSDRKDVFVWQGAIREYNGYCNYWMWGDPEDGQISTTSPEWVDRCIEKFGENRWSEPIKCECMTLRNFLEKYQVPKQIAFLNIDTVGTDRLILESFDLAEWNIEVVCVEGVGFDNDIDSYFRIRGYEKLARTAGNHIYNKIR